jgi:hypothetical protein
MPLSAADSRWLWTEAGAATMVAAVAAEAARELCGCVDRAVYLNALLGVGKGLAMAGIVFLTLLQVTACVFVMVPFLYHTSGPAPPAIALAASLLVQFAAFGDPLDPVFVLRCLGLCLSAGMLALFRFDRAARNGWQQLPTEEWILTLEEKARRACKEARAGVYCPVAALALVVWSVLGNPVWMVHGAVLEWYHMRFQAALGAASFAFQLAGMDPGTRVWLSCDYGAALEETLAALKGAWAGLRSHVRGRALARWRGRKKQL